MAQTVFGQVVHLMSFCFFTFKTYKLFGGTVQQKIYWPTVTYLAYRCHMAILDWKGSPRQDLYDCNAQRNQADQIEHGIMKT